MQARPNHDELRRERAPTRVQWNVPAAMSGVGLMRARVADWLTSAGAAPAVRASAVLVVSELLTNAVQASSGPHAAVRLQLSRTSDGWRITVADRGRGFPRRRPDPAGGLAVGGRGLVVVEHVASTVSVVRRRSGWTVVSAVVPADPASGEQVTSGGSGPSAR